MTHFMKTKGLLPCSQKSAPCRCPETDHSNLCLLSCFFRTVLISFSCRHLVLPSGLLLSIFPTKTLFAPLLCPYVPHVTALLLLLLLSSSFINFMQGIYNYITETNHVSRVCSIAALLYLQFVLHGMLFCMLNMFCTFTFVLSEVCVQCPRWLFLGTFTKLRNSTINFIMSVNMEQLGSHWTDFQEI